MRRPQLLVTGFGPFPGVAVNPTGCLVELIAARGLPGVTAWRMPTEWDVCGPLAETARAFDAVLMFGVAASAHRIRYERVALPRAAVLPDAAGRTDDTMSVPYRTTRLPVRQLVTAARREGFPVVLSHSAGRYLCNAAYGAALSTNPRTLFVHVPMPAGRGALSEDGLEAHALWLVGRVAACLPGAGGLAQLALRGW